MTGLKRSSIRLLLLLSLHLLQNKVVFCLLTGHRAIREHVDGVTLLELLGFLLPLHVPRLLGLDDLLSHRWLYLCLISKVLAS